MGISRAAKPEDGPAWTRARPDYRTSYREILASGAPPLKTLLADVGLLRSGETLSLLIDFEPRSVMRLSKRCGIESCARRLAAGGLQVLFRKRR